MVFARFGRLDLLLEDVDVLQDVLRRVEKRRTRAKVLENVSLVEEFPSAVFLHRLVAPLHRVIDLEALFDGQRGQLFWLDRALFGLNASANEPQAGNAIVGDDGVVAFGARDNGDVEEGELRLVRGRFGRLSVLDAFLTLQVLSVRLIEIVSNFANRALVIADFAYDLVLVRSGGVSRGHSGSGGRRFGRRLEPLVAVGCESRGGGSFRSASASVARGNVLIESPLGRVEIRAIRTRKPVQDDFGAKSEMLEISHVGVGESAMATGTRFSPVGEIRVTEDVLG